MRLPRDSGQESYYDGAFGHGIKFAFEPAATFRTRDQTVSRHVDGPPTYQE